MMLSERFDLIVMNMEHSLRPEVTALRMSQLPNSSPSDNVSVTSSHSALLLSAL